MRDKGYGNVVCSNNILSFFWIKVQISIRGVTDRHGNGKLDPKRRIVNTPVVHATLAAGIGLMIATSVLVHRFTDVPEGVWFQRAVDALVLAGTIDGSAERFRPHDPSTRAEFLKVVVTQNGGVLSPLPAVASFTDAPLDAWFTPYAEEAAKEEWMRGDGNCYGTSPCKLRPNARITRAEAAAVIARAFLLDGTRKAPPGLDVPPDAWFAGPLQTLADHCIIQADSLAKLRPNDSLTRAEMAVMLWRTDLNLTYGVDCGKKDMRE